MKLYIFALLVLLFSKCSLEGEYNLGAGYFLFGDKANTVIAKETKGKIAVYSEVIEGEIRQYNFNKNYIIAERRISENARTYFGSHPLWNEQKGNGDTIQFWIIDKSTDSLIGPMDWQKYVETRTLLQLPAELKFRSEDATQ